MLSCGKICISCGSSVAASVCEFVQTFSSPRMEESIQRGRGCVIDGKMVICLYFVFNKAKRKLIAYCHIKHYIKILVQIQMKESIIIDFSYFNVYQDRTLKCTVYKVTGSVPAGNYIQLPKTVSQSLGLTGRYLYLLFKPIPSKYFVAHIDVATCDGLIVRISFSNLFKEFKSTSTWLQFPFVCHAAKGSISDKTAAGSRGESPIQMGFSC